MWRHTEGSDEPRGLGPRSDSGPSLWGFSAEEPDLSLTSVISSDYSTTEDRLTLTVEGTLLEIGCVKMKVA